MSEKKRGKQLGRVLFVKAVGGVPPQYIAQKSRRQRAQWIKRKPFIAGLRGVGTHAIGRLG